MTLGAERPTVQSPLIRYAQEAAWTYLPPEEALRLRRGETGLVLHEILVRQLQRLSRVQPSIEGNLQAWEFLKGLKTVFVEAERRERNVRLLAPVNVEANAFHVTDEFSTREVADCGPP